MTGRQVGNPGVDHGSWGRPEDMTMNRPAYKIDASRPGSDVSMETAAAFAAGYLVFKDRSESLTSTSFISVVASQTSTSLISVAASLTLPVHHSFQWLLA